MVRAVTCVHAAAAADVRFDVGPHLVLMKICPKITLVVDHFILNPSNVSQRERMAMSESSRCQELGGMDAVDE